MSPQRSLLSLFSFRNAGLPPSGPARWAVIAYMALGGLVALLVPIFLGVMLWYYLFGEPPAPAP